MDPAVRARLASALKPVTYRKGDDVIKQVRRDPAVRTAEKRFVVVGWPLAGGWAPTVQALSGWLL